MQIGERPGGSRGAEWAGQEGVSTSIPHARGSFLRGGGVDGWVQTPPPPPPG